MHEDLFELNFKMLLSFKLKYMFLLVLYLFIEKQ